jgi:hypothetical protein
MEENSRAQQSEISSVEVQEIMGQIPSRIIRWGMVVLFSVIVSLVSISWFIQYPDLLRASVIITTTPAPHALVSRQSGQLILVVADNKDVQKGELIGYLKTNALPEDVQMIEGLLTSNKNIYAETLTLTLGDLQSAYSNLVSAERVLSNFLNNKAFDFQIIELKRQLITYTKLTRSLIHQLKLSSQELVLAKERYKTDSLLYTNQVLTLLDYNNAKSTWLQQQRSAETVQTSLINNEIQINDLKKQLTDTEIRKIEEQQKLEQEVLTARATLNAQITAWKERHLFTAPTSGKVVYLGFLENDLFVESSKTLFTIMPKEGTLVAKAQLPLLGSGKVKEGQEVNIRLDNYPFEQFGMLRGKVASISAMPNEERYQLTIEVPQELITSQKRKLEFRQQLTGTTEIITEDLRLLERFFYQFRMLVKAR